MKGSKFLLIVAVIGVILYFLYGKMWQVAPPPPPPDPVTLLPGERNEPGFTQPIIESVTDVECFRDTTCPSRKTDCVTKKFTAQKDTTYHLYAVYYNGDTLTQSCRLCASLYQIKAAGDTVLVESLYTACPTGGPWGAHPVLKKDSTYLLAACLHKCGDMQNCTCGEVQHSFAVISIRDLLPELKDMFKKF